MQSPADRLFALSLDLLCLVGTDGCFKQVNPAFERALGWGEAELLARPFIDFVHPDDRAGTEKAFQALLAGAPPKTVENRFRCSDGTYRWLSWRATTPDEHGLLYAIARDVTDQRAAEAERRFQATLLDAVGEAVMATDLTGTITYWNRAAETLYGWRADEVVGRSVMDVTPAEQSREQAEAIMACLRAGQKWSGEFVVRRRDGTPFRAFVTDTPVIDAAGRLTGIVGVSVDVSERHRVGEALRASEERYRTLLEQAPDTIIVADPAGRVTVANEAATRLLGYAREELVGRHIEELFAAEDIAARPLRLDELHVGAALLTERVMRRKDGLTVPVEINATRLADGSLRGIVRDVTERREAEDKLRRQTQLLQVIFDHIPAMITLADAAGRPAFANREWDRVSGWTIEEARDLDLFSELYPDPEERARVLTFMRAATGRPGDFRMRVRDGRTLDTVWVSVMLSDGSVLGMGRDVTERRQLEEQLRQAQKMEAVGRLAGGVAHDFNNLIQVITGGALFASEHLPPDSPARAELSEIEAAAGRAAALTRQLLAFSRRQVLKPERLDTNRIVSTVERMLRRVIGADVALATELQPGLPMVHADAGQLEQVLLNLAVNARDAMPDGGTLTIETREVRLDADAARRRGDLEPGAYVALRVRDTGVGMDDATRMRLFEPFFTTKEPGRGTGLGLATVYGIVTQSGGRVLVESAPGAGSTFTILLPALAGASTPTASAAAARTVGGTETILLVEDEATVRGAVRRMLERAGYAVLEAGRAADALRLLDEPDRRVALVLADVVLPDAGAETLASRIRERRRGVRILLMSGYGGEAVSRQLSAAGDTELLAKPFTPDELLRRVRDALDAPVRD